MVYVTGDTHGDFRELIGRIKDMDTTTDDVMVILGDAGINFFGEKLDKGIKKVLTEQPITFFCIHGNHEMRPQTITGYDEIEWNGGMAYIQEKYPNIVFAKDGEIYDLEGYKAITLGGAYSVDKARRIEGETWWADEQPSDEIKRYCEKRLSEAGWEVDFVFSHTCPQKYVPTEAFIPGLNSHDIDRSTEEWLDTIEDRLSYRKWYCGHWHIEKSIDNMRFMFHGIRMCEIENRDI